MAGRSSAFLWKQGRQSGWADWAREAGASMPVSGSTHQQKPVKASHCTTS